jgi:AMMECR1 domain-containing protein
MAISAVFTNHAAAVDALEELDDLNMGITILPGRNESFRSSKKKIKEVITGEKGEKIETGRWLAKTSSELVINVPADQEDRLIQLMSTIKAVIAKYEGHLVL